MKISKNLVIHPGALGDVICALPPILRFLGGSDSVDFAVDSRWGPLLQRLNAAGRWYPLESARFADLFSTASGSRLAPLLRSYGRIVAFSFSETLERALRCCIEGPVLRVPPRPEPSVRVHVADFLTDRLSRDAFGAPDAHRGDRGRLENTGSPREWNGGGILVHPGSGSLRKCWPLHRFFRLMHRLRNEGFRPTLLLGPAETERFRPFLERLPAGTDSVVIDDAVELLERIQKAEALLGNDSGVTHLAAYCGLPTLALFGPSDPVRWRPRGRAAGVMRGAPDCPPCFETDPVNCQESRCLMEIREEAVFEALLRMRMNG
jgi:heptosyltransferase-3